MKREIVVAGFGGQGVMSMGKILVEAGMAEGLEVSWVPSYGPEMRGGTSNCSVIMSSHAIGSPVVAAPTELIAMNTPSLARFEGQLVPGGMLFVNADTVQGAIHRPDVQVCEVFCDSMARELGNPKVANMVMLGAYSAATGAFLPQTLPRLISRMFTGEKAGLAQLNLRALEQGAACIQHSMPKHG